MTILYPFSISEDNRDSYLNTLLLAKENDAKVICFTSVKRNELLDDAYLHLLDLNGYYQTESNDWQALELIIDKKINIGDFENQLNKVIDNYPIDTVVCSNNTKNSYSKKIQKIDNSIKIICFDCDQ